MEQVLVESALQIIVGLVSEQGKLVCGVDDEVKVLEKELRQMKYLLEDADRAKHEGKTIMSWIADIRRLAYRAEDAIEIHAAQVSSRRRRGLKKVLDRYSCILKELHSLRQLAVEVEKIKSDLETVMDQNRIQRIMDVGRRPTESSTDWTRTTFPSFEIGDCFVGMQKELKQLISVATDGNYKERRVISVQGMGGVGKTTLVRKAYNEIIEAGKGCFDSFAWVCITQQCQIRPVLEEVLRQLRGKETESRSSMKQAPQEGDDISKLSERDLVEQLCEEQRSKRCLIVLDDLWGTRDWEGLRHAFNVQDLQTKILVTTRDQDVAAEVGFTVLQLQPLNMDEAWELLQKKAFPHGRTPEFALEEKLLEKIGKELVEKCGNLALAICILGGVLRKKNCMKDWELVNKKFKSVLYGGHDESGSKIDAVVDLSYENLPYRLKACFLCLGIFKEDEIIDVEDLYSMWIAQGMISNEGNDESLMHMAEVYLTELASTSLVQVEIEDLIPRRKYQSCKLHDVVRDLCLKIGGKEEFGVGILEYKDGGLSGVMPRVARHLAIHFKNKYDELTHTLGDENKDLRSLRILNDVKWNPIDDGEVEFPPPSMVDFKKYEFLRELVIQSFQFKGRKLPRGITDLILLRCLRLQYCGLDELPSSIRNLVYLETLDLLGSSILRLPNVFKKLFQSRLKHLFLPAYYDDVTGYCRVRLDKKGVDKLESLVGFNSSMHELRRPSRMKNLRLFAAEIHDNKSLSVIMQAINTEWNKLQDCAVEIKGDCEFTSVEEMMQIFTCPNLSYLGLSIELGKLPAVSSDFLISSKLVGLSLNGCVIEDDPMGMLGMLPLLKQLNFYHYSFVGEHMTCPTSSFPSLQTLELSHLPNLREWKVERGAMPLLHEIKLYGCPNFELLPDGLSCISTLKRVSILNMPELGKRVSASGEDFHKIRHVPSLHIQEF